jgi:hypothetical protein
MDPSHSFDFPVADLTAGQQAALTAALQREHIEHRWAGGVLQVDVAFEPRVTTLVDQVRSGLLAPVDPTSVPGAPGPASAYPATFPGAAPTMPGAAPTTPGYAPAQTPYQTAPSPAGYPGAYPGNSPGGYPSGGYGAPGTYVAPPRTNGMAVASLVLGLVSLLCLGLVAGIPAIITGYIARRQIANSGGAERGDGMAVAGLITGWIATGLSALVLLFYVVFFLIILVGASTV